ncbi:MAG: hypothetical protein DRN12_01280 [Thermoplasmata archaeon]|nr:MAG: hypothetical protein DRN12_01280 [Thermoplasmata archaeon]
MEKHDVIIIGGGPAGVTAAIQLIRYGIDILLFEKGEIGGLLRNAYLIENYPGFPDGIPGGELVELFSQHLKKLDVPIEFREVKYLDYHGNLFSVFIEDREVSSKIVVIATGTTPKELPRGILPRDLLGKKVFYDIINLQEISDRTIGIIGGGDAAFDYALSLSKGNKIEIFNRKEKPRCIPVLWKRCLENPSIRYHPNVIVDKIRKVEESIVITSSNIEFKLDYLIIAIGRKPCLPLLSPEIKENIEKLVEENRLYLIGDVVNGRKRQTAISIGDGMRAAMEIIHLKEEGMI